MTYVAALALTLALLVGLTIPLKDKCARITAAALLGNWLVNTAGAWAFGDHFGWVAMGAVDYTTAIAILALCTARASVLIALSYAVQVIAHVAFAMSDRGFAAQLTYWWELYSIAWGQAALMGLWIAHGGFRLLHRRRNADRRAPDRSAVPSSLGGVEGAR